jgi:CysZ protein
VAARRGYDAAVLSRFLAGAGYARRGASLLSSDRRLWRWVWLPFVVTLAVYAGGVAAALVWFDDLVTAVLPMPGGWLGAALWGLLYALAVAALAVAAYASFFALASAIAAPFNELLSESIEHAVTGTAPPSFSLRRLARDLALGVGHAARRLIAYAAIMAALFIVGLVVPVVGWAAYVAGGALVTARFAAYDALDAAMARRGWSYAHKRAFLRHHRAATLGLGAAIAALVWIPVVGALAMSIGAAGGTLLFLDAARGARGAAGGHDAGATG